MLDLLARQYPGPHSFLRGPYAHRELFHGSQDVREGLRVVGGQFRFGLHIYFDSPCRYLTLLRDPIERVISHYASIRARAGHPWHRRLVESGISLEEWVRLGDADAADNLQVRWLATREGENFPFRQMPRELLAEAKRVLARRIELFGITERFDDTVRLFARVLGWREPVVAERHNASPNRAPVAELTARERAAIVEHNALDLELHAFASELFERRIQANRAAGA